MSGQVHVAVAVKVHLNDYDQVNEDVEARWPPIYGELYLVQLPINW